jgi:2-polyprenyl-6-hydroxyphenyl methylase/3-demethylubiquinone-9 3-methyltransferase
MLSWKWSLAQWFELRWWKSYLKRKDKQTYLQWKRNYWNNLLHEMIPYISLNKWSTIVDLGCGPAGIFVALSENKVVAVDPLIDAYETQTHFFKKSDYPNVTFINDSIENFKSRGINPKYDLVFCMNAINHVNDIQNSFQNLKALCKNEGSVVVSVDAHRFSSFKYLFRLIPGDILHPHQYDLKEYQQLLAGEDWQITACKELKQEFFFSHYWMVAKHKS